MTFPTIVGTLIAVPTCLASCADGELPPIRMTKFSNMRARFSAISPRGSPFQEPRPAPNYVTHPTYPPWLAHVIQPLAETGHSDTLGPSEAVRAALSHDWNSRSLSVDSAAGAAH